MSFKHELDKRIQASRRPVAIFDLDGTLFDVTYRSMEILKRFLAQPDTRSHFPEQWAAASKLRYQDFLYSLEATLNNIGIDRYSEYAARFLHAAETYWFKHFFTDDFVVHDVPYPGALSCVQSLRQQGVHIVYLSGRDIPNMSRGTLQALENHGFPHQGHGITVCLKPAYGQDDLLFKKQSIETISSEGEVIFTIDNEPANVQMFLERFPEAFHVHFHSLFARPMELRGQHLRVAKSFGELGYA
ncbi:MAG: HAD family hydrolase [Bdellovibrionota bacterium]